MLKRVLKYAPMKSEFVRAVVQDETIKTEISEDMYMVNDSTEILEGSAQEVNENAEADTDRADS